MAKGPNESRLIFDDGCTRIRLSEESLKKLEEVNAPVAAEVPSEIDQSQWTSQLLFEHDASMPRIRVNMPPPSPREKR